MYNMNSNVFSISEDVIISEQNFTRLNTWLRDQGFTSGRSSLCRNSKTRRVIALFTQCL